MPFVLEWTESALMDLAYFRRYEQTLIVDQTDVQLTHEPGTETRHRKPLEPNALADWELRIGDYRVFYDIDTTGAKVKVKAIGCKTHDRLTIRGTEYTL